MSTVGALVLFEVNSNALLNFNSIFSHGNCRKKMENCRWNRISNIFFIWIHDFGWSRL